MKYIVNVPARNSAGDKITIEWLSRPTCGDVSDSSTTRVSSRFPRLATLRRVGREKEAEFKAKGGRGVELADEIDELRDILGDSSRTSN